MIQEIISLILALIGAATLILRAIKPFTDSTAPDNILRYLEKFLEVLALDSKALEDYDSIKVKLQEKN